MGNKEDNDTEQNNALTFSVSFYINMMRVPKGHGPSTSVQGDCNSLTSKLIIVNVHMTFKIKVTVNTNN